MGQEYFLCDFFKVVIFLDILWNEEQFCIRVESNYLVQFKLDQNFD